jgi:pescadillo
LYPKRFAIYQTNKDRALNGRPGIFPREPNNKRKANKGSSAPTSFYYTKDIAYLAHEPVLKRLREHKAFAKKLSRALGRGEWSAAKSLEENKPIYRLDHIIKERYVAIYCAMSLI